MLISSFSAIEQRSKISSQEFRANFVQKGKPILISGKLQKWPSLNKWSAEYFKQKAPDLKILVKNFTTHKEIESKTTSMEEYANLIKAYEIHKRKGQSVSLPPYCHDLPLFSLIPSLVKDVQPFPLDYLPKWYHYKWWRYCQFFIGSSDSITPLHFDCLLTNNIFFQVVGRKQFTILMPEDAEYCYRHSWRWFKVNPENPDLDKYPEYKKAKPITFIVNPGDILYMPPGTLHHVRSLDMSISFNIDWHTEKSSLNGIVSSLKGMPPKNVYYNFLITMGLLLKVPSQLIFPFYKSYLNYVS